MYYGTEPLGRNRSCIQPMLKIASTSLCTVTVLDSDCRYGAWDDVLRSAIVRFSLDVAPSVGWSPCYWTVTRPCRRVPQSPGRGGGGQFEAVGCYYSCVAVESLHLLLFLLLSDLSRYTSIA